MEAGATTMIISGEATGTTRTTTANPAMAKTAVSPLASIVAREVQQGYASVGNGFAVDGVTDSNDQAIALD